MKTPAQRARLLVPTTPAPIEEKWRAAWNLLDEDKSPDVLPEHRAHARCWLTYRAIEGHVKRDEFMNRVRAVEWPNEPAIPARWETSIAAAEFYLFTLWDMEREALDASSVFLFTDFWHKEHPPAILSYLRVQCVFAYEQFLAGNHEACFLTIQTAVNVWKSIMARLDWQAHPIRWLDARGDMHALHAMMCMADKMGKLADPVETRTIQDMKEPWVLCLKHLSRRKNAIFV